MTIPSPASWATDMATLPMTKPCATDTDAPEVRRVLFVCTGNTCRSPMAAALLNHLSRPREVCSACGESGEVPRYAASSAGLYAMAGDPITPHAAAALAAFGVPSLPSNDYTAHRARPVTEALLEAADVVVMDDDPMKIVRAIRLARKCLAIVRQNIIFALGVKGLCLLLVAVGAADMWLGIFADVGVMVLAVLNAMRALRVEIGDCR